MPPLTKYGIETGASPLKKSMITGNAECHFGRHCGYFDFFQEFDKVRWQHVSILCSQWRGQGLVDRENLTVCGLI